MFSISAIIMSMNVGSTEATNLAAIKWKHAVNSWQLLNESLHSKCTNMDFFVCYVNDLHQFTVKIDNFTVELLVNRVFFMWSAYFIDGFFLLSNCHRRCSNDWSRCNDWCPLTEYNNCAKHSNYVASTQKWVGSIVAGIFNQNVIA